MQDQRLTSNLSGYKHVVCRCIGVVDAFNYYLFSLHTFLPNFKFASAATHYISRGFPSNCQANRLFSPIHPKQGTTKLLNPGGKDTSWEVTTTPGL